MSSELETNIVAVERVKEYSETPTEVCLMWLKFGFGSDLIFLLSYTYYHKLSSSETKGTNNLCSCCVFRLSGSYLTIDLLMTGRVREILQWKNLT